MDSNIEKSYSEIKQTADKISIKVSKGEMGSLIEQNPESVKVSWNQNSKYVTLDDDEGLILGNPDEGTYSKVGYNGRLELFTGGDSQPYHALTQIGQVVFTNAEDIEDKIIKLDSKFKDTKAYGIGFLTKVTCDGSSACNWLASYLSELDTHNLTAKISGQANYRILSESHTFEQTGGTVIVSYMIIA